MIYLHKLHENDKKKIHLYWHRTVQQESMIFLQERKQQQVNIKG